MGSDITRRLGIFIGVLIFAVVLIAPTVFRDSIPDGWPSKPISLGLDLSGGVHLVYEVEVEEAVKSRLQVTANAMKSELRGEKIAVTSTAIGDNNDIRLTLLTSRLTDKAKSAIDDQFGGEVTFREISQNGSRPVLVYGISEQEAAKVKTDSVSQAIETLRNRVDQFGVAEPLIQKVGERRILLQMPGVSDIESVKKVVGSVARLEFRLTPTGGASTVGVVNLVDRDGSPTPVEDEVLMSGEAIDDARVSPPLDGQVEVLLTLTSEGGRTFRRITGDNVGRNLAIVLDGVVYSAPELKEKISGGRASISGGFTMDEAHQLAVVLRAGALPAPLTILEERTVGPTLGQESIEKGVLAVLIGFALIIAFMIVYYKKSGIVAIATLALNMVFVLSLLSAFGATLTLPGIAGLALTIGMAVDANVIIFERIREEIRNGSTRDAAVAAGFEKALSAILDSNVTTLLAGLILYYFGTGPIRGFAVTLSIGIVTTIYCATFVSRLAFDSLELKGAKGLSV